MINDIIDISKLDSGLMQVNETKLNLNNLISDVYEMFIQQISKNNKGLKFKIINQYQGSEYVLTDSLHLKQILINLIGNALKFTKIGFVEVKYMLGENEDINFSVEDTGIGIEKEQLPFVFNRFRQVGNTTEELFGGIGLGLSITKAYVELLGGNITVQSEFNKGSTFKFSIPYKPL